MIIAKFKNIYRLREINIYLVLVVFMTTSTSIAQADLCEQAYREAMNSPKLITAESRIKHLKQFESQCAGSGLYESRLSYFYVENNDYLNAKLVLLRGLEKKNEYHNSLKFSLIDLLVKQGRLEEALADAHQLQQEYPDWYGSFVLLVKITFLQKKYDDSIRYSEKVIALNPSADVYSTMGVALHRIGKHELAINAISHAIEIKPALLAQSFGTNELIYSLSNLQRDDEAKKYILKRIKLDGDWKNDKEFVKAVEYYQIDSSKQ